MENPRKKADRIASNISAAFFIITLLVIAFFFPDFPFESKGFLKIVKIFVIGIPLALISALIYSLVENMIKRYYGED